MLATINEWSLVLPFSHSIPIDLMLVHSRQAMLRLAAAGADDLSKEKMRAIFCMVDTDKSQSLDAEELGNALRSFNSKLTAVSFRSSRTLILLINRPIY